MAEPNQWAPSYNPEQTKNLIQSYSNNPGIFNPSQLDVIRNHAQYHNVPFYEGEFSILDALKQAGVGFIEGFTTFNVSDEYPDNEWEAIARNIGHLVGFAPGIITSPLSKIKALRGLTSALPKRGIPLAIAEDILKPRAAKVANKVLGSNFLAKNAAYRTATDFLRTDLAKDIVSGAFTLGTASAISSWQHGVDSMMDSFFHGAIAGGGFKVIGNKINLGDKKATTFAKALAGSAFMGIPSTLRGATTPEQVYEYLLGAYFGGKERTWAQTKAAEVFYKENIPFARKSGDPYLESTLDPTRFPSWKEAPKEVRTELLNLTKKMTGLETGQEPGTLGYGLIEKVGEQFPEVLKVLNKKQKSEVKKELKIEKKEKELIESSPESKPKIKKELVKLKKEVSKKSKQKKPTPIKQKFIMTSGKRGLDTLISEKGNKEGLNTIQLKVGGQRSIGKKIGDSIILTPTTLNKQDSVIRLAVEEFNANADKTGANKIDVSKWKGGSTGQAFQHLRRAAVKMKLADSIVMFGDVKNLVNLGGVNNLRGQMAKNTGKPFYVVDKNLNTILKWNPKGEHPQFKTKGVFEVEPLTPELGDRIAFFTPEVFSKRDTGIMNKLLEKQAFMDKKGQLLPDTEKKDNNVDINVSDISPGEGIELAVDTSLGGRINYEMSNFDKFIKKYPKIQERQLAIKKIIEKSFDTHEEYLQIDKAQSSGKNPVFETRSTDWIARIERESGEKLSPELKGQLRQWLVAKKWGKQVEVIQSDGTVEGTVIPDGPSRIKMENAPESPLETAYKKYKKTDEPVNAYIDSIRLKNGQDVKLSRFIDSLARQLVTRQDRHGNYKYKNYESAYKAAEDLKIEYTKNIVKSMEKKGMHLFGGEGDKDRLVFVKYHPELNKVKIPENAIPKDLFKFGEENYGLTKEQEIKGLKSNLKYQEDINGVPSEQFINKDGWINSTVKLNKRLPVILNTGWRADKMFLNTPSEVGNLRLSQNGNFKAVIVKDAEGLVELIGAKNTELLQSTDGGILTESRTLNGMQKDRGSNFQGQEKSIFVDNGLLAKYMQHKVIPEVDVMMREFKNSNPEFGDGINMIIYGSAAKQLGPQINKVGNYEVKNGKLELTEGAEVFELDPSSFRYNYGVYDSVSNLGIKNGRHKGISMPKQLNLIPHLHMMKDVDPKALDTWFQDLAGRAFNGTREANNELTAYKNQMNSKDIPLPGAEVELIKKHFSEMGVREIEKILTEPGYEKLAQEMILEILNTSHESIRKLEMEGEGYGQSVSDELNNISDFRTSAENIIKHASSLGQDAFPLFYGKYTKPYVEKAINKWISDKVFNPKIKNSLKGRMRPYDKGLVERFPELNDDKLSMKKWGVPSHELLVVGDLYKPLPFYNSVTKKMSTLEKVWKEAWYETNPTKKKEYDDLFKALTVRVPQDAASGAQVLKFIGFTGIKDYGTLLHGRTMEMLGGADLDADSDFIFFGGRHSDGSGHGLRPEHMKMYRDQRNEFIANNKYIDVKKMFKDDIVLTRDNLEEMGVNPLMFDYSQNTNNKHPYLQFSPTMRAYVGQETAKSRTLMPSAVSLVQNSRIAWSSILNSPSGQDVIETGTIIKTPEGAKLKEPIIYRIIRTPKSTSEDKQMQIALSSALIRYTADPANELGLIGYKEMQTLLDKTYYNPREVEIFTKDKGWIKDLTKGNPVYVSKGGQKYGKQTLEVKRTMAPDVKKASRYDLISSINRAFFGWDFTTGRNWTFNEIQNLTKEIDSLSPQELNSMLPRIANIMKNVDTRVSIFDRVNKPVYDKILSNHNKLMKNLPKKNEWKNLIKRNKLEIPSSKQIDFVFKYNLSNRFKREQLAELKPSEIIELFRKSDIKDSWHNIKPKDSKETVLNKLDVALSNAAEYLENAVWEASSLDLVLKKYQESVKAGKRISKSEMNEIIKMVEFVKEAHTSKLKQRQQIATSPEVKDESTLQHAKTDDPFFMMIEKAKEASRSPVSKRLKKTKGTSLLDQLQIDNIIRTFKEGLSSKYSRDMFDLYMLGSLRSHETHKNIQKYMKLSKKDPLKQPFIQGLMRQGSRANTSQAAFNSKAIASKNIKEFLQAQLNLYDTKLNTNKTSSIPTKVTKHIKKFEDSELSKVLDFNEQVKKLKLEDTIISDISGFENIKKGKLTPEQSKVILELANLIKSDNNFNMKKFNQTLMGLYSYIDPMDPVVKSLDQMNLTDFKNIIRTYKQIKKGSIHKYWEEKLPLLKRLSLKARHHMQFPLMVSTEQMASDIIHLKKKKFLKDWNVVEAKEVDVLYPTSWGEIMQSQIHRISGMQEAHSQRKINELTDKLRFLGQLPNNEGLALHNIATARIELKQNFENSETQSIYQKHWERIRDGYNWPKLREKSHNIDLNDGKGRNLRSGYEIVKMIENTLENHYNAMQELNTGVLLSANKEQYKKFSKAEKNLWRLDSETGFYTKHPLEEYTLGFYDSKPDGKTYNTQRILNIDRFIKDMQRQWAKGTDKALDFAVNVGSDGMRQLMRSMAIELMPIEQYINRVYNRKTRKYEDKIISRKEYESSPAKYRRQGFRPDKEFNIKKLEDLIIPLTGYRKGYIPHYFNDSSVSRDIMKKELAEISGKYNKIIEKNKLKVGSQEYKDVLNDYTQEYKSAVMKYKFQNGDYNLGQAQEFQTALDLTMFPKMKNELAESEYNRMNLGMLPNQFRRAGHTRSRENNKSSWIVDPAIHSIYIENTTKDLYGGLTNLLTRWTLNKMNDHNWKTIAEPRRGKKDFEEAKKVVEGWDYFWRQYVREAQGMPTIVSDKAWERPDLHISTTPYGWFADNVFANWINKVGKTLNIINKDGSLPKELTGMDNYDVQKLSNLEARFQLATLMTHPKTPINNIFGGTMHTFQSTGYEPMRKAYDYNYLQTINPKLKTETDVKRFLDEHGIQVELARSELGLDKAIRNLNNDNFVKEIASKSVGDKDITKSELRDIQKKYKVSDSIMKVAAKFMSIPERRLRRDAFLAHYIKAWERMGGAVKNPSSPILIEVAKKGVQATQFLYSAPFRPGFARSGVGKVMSRFQLWAWNAVRFRNDVRKLAQRYGYKPGTEGMTKFQRMMTTDLFVMALGSVFMYSLFEQVIPAPYNWMQDTADWLFGNSKERERAFFGQYPGALAPLQMITPPLARIPISIYREFAEDDYTKLADYYMWTMFPFGRIARDLFHPEQNVFINPMRIPEKFFGIPVTGFAKESKKIRESSYHPPTPGRSIDIF